MSLYVQQNNDKEQDFTFFLTSVISNKLREPDQDRCYVEKYFPDPGIKIVKLLWSRRFVKIFQENPFVFLPDSPIG